MRESSERRNLGMHTVQTGGGSGGGEKRVGSSWFAGPLTGPPGRSEVGSEGKGRTGVTCESPA